MTLPRPVIRPAGREDIAGLQALDTVAQTDPGRAAAIARWVEAEQCFCLEHDGALLGYGAVAPHFFGQAMLEMIMVGSAARGRGIGRRLVRHAIDTVTGPVLWTSTNFSNLPMQTLLEGAGFSRSGYVEGLDEGDPELIYRIALPAA